MWTLVEKILNQILDGYEQEMQADLCRLLTFDTTKAEPQKMAPFGQGIADALDFVLQKAAGWGFACQNLDGYVGLVDYGSGPQQAGVLSHLDTVPIGNGWTVDAFGGRIIDGKIYGRGAVDNKGPLMACLYAARAIKESGLPCRFALRQILGTDEESGFGCMKYFLQKCQPPDFGFTPDADFPLIYGEKGIIHLELTADFITDGGIVVSAMKGGVGGNVIPDRAEAMLCCDEDDKRLIGQLFDQYRQKDDLILLEEDNGYKVVAKGKTAHGSIPCKGCNAIVLLLDFLRRLPLGGSAGSFISSCYKLLGQDFDGTALGAYAEDEYAKTSMAPTLLFLEGQKASVHIDFRFPITFNGQYFCDKILKTAVKHQMKISCWKCKEPLFVPLDSPFLQKILAAYREMTGDMGEPLVIGGGTYARSFKNFVGYGPLFPGQEMLAHQADEYMTTEDLLLLSKIYSQTMYNLIK
jgi:succinyl-diaminopimelate desuccinylase